MKSCRLFFESIVRLRSSLNYGRVEPMQKMITRTIRNSSRQRPQTTIPAVFNSQAEVAPAVMKDFPNPALTEADPEEVENAALFLKPTFSVAAYVNKSKSLQQLVKLGVDLHKIEKKKGDAEFLLRLDFDRDIQPYVTFLHDLGVAADNLGAVLSKNIRICQESMEDLQVRVNYLESKRFTRDQIADIVTRNPFWLSTPVSVIDGQLGWIQKTFKLNGEQVRSVVSLLPQIGTASRKNMELNLFVLKEEMCMTDALLKKIMLTKPRIYTKGQTKLLASFEYVHNTMNVPLDQICAQPDILMQRVINIKERHEFLVSVGRAQYNPRLPGYISLDALLKSDDETFCTELAKSSIQSYNLFLKTL